MLIGVDIIDISRLRDAVIRTPHFLERVFTQQEIDYCYNKKDPYPSLAARFAAREAFRKLDHVFIKGIKFHDTEVVVDSNGKPTLILSGNAMQRALQEDIRDFSISLSHSAEQAIAVIIANKG